MTRCSHFNIDRVQVWVADKYKMFYSICFRKNRQNFAGPCACIMEFKGSMTSKFALSSWACAHYNACVCTCRSGWELRAHVYITRRAVWVHVQDRFRCVEHEEDLKQARSVLWLVHKITAAVKIWRVLRSLYMYSEFRKSCSSTRVGRLLNQWKEGGRLLNQLKGQVEVLARNSYLGKGLYNHSQYWN